MVAYMQRSLVETSSVEIIIIELATMLGASDSWRSTGSSVDLVVSGLMAMEGARIGSVINKSATRHDG
jgi:hypothetical protein